jgi:hypothetical protein
VNSRLWSASWAEIVCFSAGVKRVADETSLGFQSCAARNGGRSARSMLSSGRQGAYRRETYALVEGVGPAVERNAGRRWRESLRVDLGPGREGHLLSR